MVSKNNVIQSVHLRKHWNMTTSQKGHVKTYFDQAGRKLRRRIHRAKKARRVFPRPADNFRPVVHCATQRYNMKVRAGRGYSLAELRKAKISRVMAKQFHISVDYRRRTERTENINRLKAYRARIVVNPKGADLKQIHGDIIPITGVSRRVRAIPLPPRGTKKNRPKPVPKKPVEKKPVEKKAPKEAPKEKAESKKPAKK